MKKVMFTLVISAAALFTSCTKDHEITNDGVVKGFNSDNPGVPAGPVITSWERGNIWAVSDSLDYKVFAHNRSLPAVTKEVLKSGAVLVFVKNILYDDGRRVTKPLRVPFHVLPSFGRPGYDQAWYNINTVGNILVKYRTNKHKYGIEAQLPDEQVMVRIFVLSPEDLIRLDKTPVSISRLTYQELTDLLGTNL
ncbi:MAG: hypothetical protein ACXWV0_04465 [Flavisolibacter sp.]